MIPVAIVGAGIAGLACAAKLVRAGRTVVVFDKGRGVGGRVATRRAGQFQFDHGAQFITAQGAEFAAVLEGLVRNGSAAGWDDGSGRAVTVGTPGMSGLAKALAVGLDVRTGAPVTSVTRDGSGWLLQLGDRVERAARVVLTVPAPQVAGLIGKDHALVASLADVRYVPCLTLMAVGTGAAPFVTRREPADALAWIAQDSSKPGRPAVGGTAWVAQAGPQFSEAHLERDMKEVAALMLPLLCDRLGFTADQMSQAVAHRWRYAAVTAPLGQPSLCTDDATLHLGGDWCIGPRVEAAWTSGTAIADDILSAAA